MSSFLVLVTNEKHIYRYIGRPTHATCYKVIMILDFPFIYLWFLFILRSCYIDHINIIVIIVTLRTPTFSLSLYACICVILYLITIMCIIWTMNIDDLFKIGVFRLHFNCSKKPTTHQQNTTWWCVFFHHHILSTYAHTNTHLLHSRYEIILLCNPCWMVYRTSSN